MKIIRVLITLVFVLLLSACSNSAVKAIPKAPEVSVYGVKIAKMSFTEAQLNLALRINNPNSFSIPLRGFDYALNLNGIPVAKGTDTKNLTISSGEDRIIEVPIVVSLMELFRTVPAIVKSRKFTYNLDGRAHFPLVKLPFKRTGLVGNY